MPTVALKYKSIDSEVWLTDITILNKMLIVKLSYLRNSGSIFSQIYWGYVFWAFEIHLATQGLQTVIRPKNTNIWNAFAVYDMRTSR